MTEPDIGHNELPTKQKRLKNKFFFRLPPQHISFYEAMAQDYYQRGRIPRPRVSLLAKKCLMNAGNSWNRMQLQVMNQEYERKIQQELERQRQQNYQQQRREFVQTSDNLAPHSVPNIRPPLFVEEMNRRLQRGTGNPANIPMTKSGHPTFTPWLDTSCMNWKPHQRQHQHQQQPMRKKLISILTHSPGFYAEAERAAAEQNGEYYDYTDEYGVLT